MSFLSDVRYTPTAAKLPGSSAGTSGGDDPRIPLMNLSVVQARMDFLQKFLSDSVNNNVLLGQPQMEIVSSEIASAIQQVIVNGAALLSSNHTLPAFSPVQRNPNPVKLVSPNVEIRVYEALKLEEDEIIELDAVELLAEHVHFCEICGKGFKRDANLRMHMRAHGNQFKSPEALAKPRKSLELASRRVKFSCPFVGCNRNKQHKKFRPLKSAICVKNHFKRSHCPKMHTCTRCNKKNFSVMADLKSHLKHCGDTRWRCSCGTNFSRKDKLFGHIALFEGHMPAMLADEIKEAEEKGGDVTEVEAVTAVGDEDEVMNDRDTCFEFDNKNHYFDGLNSIDDYYYEDLLNSRVSEYSLEFGVGGYFIF